MRILHLSSEKTWRGGEQQIAYLIDELQQHGIKNYVAARIDSVFEEHCKKNNIPCLPLPFRNSFDFQTALGIKKFCKEHRIDLVHMHSAKSHALGVIAGGLGNTTPLILSRRVVFPPKRNFLTRWKYNHRMIKRIVGVSDKITEIMSSYVNDPSKCVTVHSGIDLQKFSQPPKINTLRTQFNIGPETTLIGNTSALEYEKDYPTFIRVIKALHDNNIRVKGFIIGKGSLKEWLTKLIQDLGLQDVIHLTGFRKDIDQILPALDIFLITSTEEGLGTSVLDAFAAKVCVVATDAGGIPEMVKDNVTGMLRPIGDITKLSEAISTLIIDRDLRQRLITNASESLKEFSKARTAEKTLAIYQQVLQELKK
jgi:L-malate glycosyltransferase